MNVLRWSTPSGDARARPSRRRSSSRIPPFEGQPRPGRHRGEFRAHGLHRRHPPRCALHGWRVTSTLVVEVRPPAARRRAVRVRVLRRASTRSRTSSGWATTTTPSSRPPTASWRRWRPRCRPEPRSSSRPTTVRSTWASRSSPSTPTCWPRRVLLSGEGRFRWLHARPGRADGSRTSAGPATATWPGCAAARRPRGRRAASAGRSTPGAAPGWATSPSSPSSRSPSSTRPTRASRAWSSRHGSLTPAELLVPLVAAAR